jgi:hypothetical protein
VISGRNSASQSRRVELVLGQLAAGRIGSHRRRLTPEGVCASYPPATSRRRRAPKAPSAAPGPGAAAHARGTQSPRPQAAGAPHARRPTRSPRRLRRANASAIDARVGVAHPEHDARDPLLDDDARAHPTQGLSPAVPRASSASASARRISRSCSDMDSLERAPLRRLGADQPGSESLPLEREGSLLDLIRIDRRARGQHLLLAGGERPLQSARKEAAQHLLDPLLESLLLAALVRVAQRLAHLDQIHRLASDHRLDLLLQSMPPRIHVGNHRKRRQQLPPTPPDRGVAGQRIG